VDLSSLTDDDARKVQKADLIVRITDRARRGHDLGEWAEFAPDGVQTVLILGGAFSFKLALDGACAIKMRKQLGELDMSVGGLTL